MTQASLSSRITSINGGGSDGWGVFHRARRMIADGVPVIELTIGEHDVRTDPLILDAMHAAATGGHTGYAEIPGTRTLRQTVAERVAKRTGVPTTADNVLITPGAQAALFAAHVATCDPGDTALFLDPYYATYPGTIRSAGAIPQPVPTRADNGFRPQAADIAPYAGKARSLLINSPNNPTGVVYCRDTLQDLGTLCQDRDMWLISDEVYDSQVWEGEHVSPRALPGMAERTLVLGSMSKSHAMTGSRCGWIVGPQEAVAHLITLSTHTNYGVPGFIQDASVFAFGQGDALEHAIAEPFRRRRALALRILGRQQAVRVIPPQGAMYLMLDIRATGMSGEAFALELLDEHNIAVMPGESFGQAAAGHLRVAMTVDDDRFAAALETLCAFAAARVRADA
ncbi:MAG: aspartate aminotransferase [Rhodobacteraceae bacterium]|nr:aspartate aminotransferase [Paracoccaceae bacterium]MAY47360.1 aspartate aminotransferase [Paracoccaceae bacterium]QEW19888.1 Arginine--pyruvate transaminase AruH [Marinibacterium anthonyi]